MSWEAVTWASKQKLKKSYEQIVLLVLANCADPNGEAFVKWPGRDHWWIYLSERTRLPKSSLFRHLNTLVALGLGERSMQVLADGSRRPTFKLNMAADFDIDLPEDHDRYQAAFAKGSQENQSPVGTEHDDGFEVAENDSDISHSQEAETAGNVQSPPETGNPPSQSPVGTKPFPVLRLQEDSLAVPKDSPLPPSGGAAALDELFEEFTKAWREPMTRPSLVRSVWDGIPTAKRGEAITAARGYFAWLGKQAKPPSTVSAQTFLREVTGWAQWLPWAGTPTSSPSVAHGFSAGSAEARALFALHDLAGKLGPFRQIHAHGGVVTYSRPMTPRLAAMAQTGPRDGWVVLTRQQAAAWEGLLREAVVFPVRTPLKEGDRAPWPWPPGKEGQIYTATGPPDAGLSDNELADFK